MITKTTAQYLALGVASLLIAGSANAQLPISRPGGVLPVPVTGNNTATAVSIPFIQESTARDIVSAVAGQDITGVGGGYTPGAFANNSMVLIVSGPSRGTGLPITANTATTFTVAGTVPALSANVDQFEIVPLNTISSVLGTPGTNSSLAGASSAASADKIIINGIQYFYKTSGANAPGWKLTTAPNAAGSLGNTTISNLAGVNVLRVGVATNVVVKGIKRSTRAVVPIPTGTSLVSCNIHYFAY